MTFIIFINFFRYISSSSRLEEISQRIFLLSQSIKHTAMQLRKINWFFRLIILNRNYFLGAKQFDADFFFVF